MMKDSFSNTVLIVTPDEQDINHIINVLSGSEYNYITAKSVVEALSNITYKLPNLIISDLELPEIDGLDLLRKIRTGIKTRLIPFIFLSESHDTFDRIEAYQGGADAYLVKPVVPEELKALTQSKLKQLNEFYHLSVTDELTRLYNRREFLKRFNNEIYESEKGIISLALIDIDHFKRVNDQYGHQMGDNVLMTLGDVLKRHSTERFFPARFGGEEFVMLFPGLSAAEARIKIDTIRDELKGIDFKTGNRELFRVSFSAGIAEYPVMGNNLSHLLSRADHALYAAKEEGRDRTLVYSSVMARNDRFWEYLKTRKEVYIDANGHDLVTGAGYLPAVLEEITNLDFEIKSIGTMSISLSSKKNISTVRGIKNYHYDMENISRIIMASCENHFPSDTYLCLADLYEYDFFILFPSFVDFSFNVDKFHELCKEIAGEIEISMSGNYYNIRFSSDVVYYEKESPRDLISELKRIREESLQCRSMISDAVDALDICRSVLTGNNSDIKKVFSRHFCYDLKTLEKAFQFVSIQDGTYESSILDIAVHETVKDEKSLQRFLECMAEICSGNSDIPVLLPMIRNVPFEVCIDHGARFFPDRELVIMINEKWCDHAVHAVCGQSGTLPGNISLGLSNCFIGNDILNIISMADLRLLSFSEHCMRNIHLFRERIKIVNGVKIFADQLGTSVMADNILSEEEFHVVKDLGISFASGRFLENMSNRDGST
ncbi:MAG TPA: diguanylate cyclase [Spirochaetota bacterium]|nr:diguanylate cyclase [Spirochaetota bacterium]